MFSLGGILLGIINIAIVVAILLLVGAVIVWFMSWMQFAVPWNVQRLYIAVVALIALYMLVALLLGFPTVRVIGRAAANWPNYAQLTPTQSIALQSGANQAPFGRGF